MLKIGLRQPFLNKLIAICVLTLFGATAATARDALEIYRGVCAVCHGEKGEGKRALGPALDGSTFIIFSPDADIKKTIQNGRAGAEKKYADFAGPMPPHKSLTETEFDALVKYLKDLNREVIAILNSSTSVQEKKEFEFKDLIGKKFTFFSPILKDKSQTEYYESLSNFKMRKMPLKVPFAIEEIVSQGFSNYYRLKFKGDKVGYIDTFLFAEDLEFMNYKCSNCESVGMPSVEILREASKKAVWSDIFKKEGISKGSYVWLKYSRFDLPWLTKMIIKDYKLNDETLPLELELLFEVDGNEMQSSLYTPELNDLFYVSDPAPRIAKWGKRVLTAIKDNKVFIGMTKEQVRASWGLSDDINRTVGPWGVHEQWIYENNSAYLYFQNDKLTSWQD